MVKRVGSKKNELKKMSLVNSMINQIGREIGKDVYKGLKSSVTASSVDNYSFQKEINEFKLAAYDKVTIKNLVNLIEKSDDINPRGFNDWESCYLDLDDKIDFCKQHLDASHLPKLEELDKINSVNYAMAKERHKTFVSNKIESVKTEIKKHEDSNILIPIIVSMLGLNSFYYKTKWWTWHILSMLVVGFLVINATTNTLTNEGVLLSYQIGVAIYCLVLLASFIRIGKEAKKIKNLKEEVLPNLEGYYTTNFN